MPGGIHRWMPTCALEPKWRKQATNSLQPACRPKRPRLKAEMGCGETQSSTSPTRRGQAPAMNKITQVQPSKALTSPQSHQWIQ